MTLTYHLRDGSRVDVFGVDIDHVTGEIDLVIRHVGGSVTVRGRHSGGDFSFNRADVARVEIDVEA